MPSITVSVPTRLRVDARSLRDGRRELADALGSATTRAVASAHIALPGAIPVADAPTFRWSGDSAAEVDAGTRAEIETLCTEQIARALGAVSAAGKEEAALTPSPGAVPPMADELPDSRPRQVPPRAAAGATQPTVTPADVEHPVEFGGISVALPSGRLKDIETLAEGALAAEQERASRPTRCDPFFDEPSIFDLGPISHELRRRIAEIADLLEIDDPCPYGGAFLLTSADILLLRVLDIGLADVVEAGTNVATGPGGTEVRFRPSSSVQLEALQVLATVVPLLTGLTQLLEQVPEGMPLGWAPALHERLDLQLDEVVATLFRLTCRVLFLQVLNTSRIAIETRRADPAFEQFADLFAAVVTRPRSEIAELTELRERLAGGVPAFPTRRVTTWREALWEVDRALAGTAEGEILEEAGVRRIRTRSGRSWTFEELDVAIAARRAAPVSADPLVNQLALVPEVDARFRIPDVAVPGELRRLLDDLYTIVVEQTLHAAADPDLGFAWAHVVPADGTAMVPYTIYLLQGLHLLAHELLSDDFADDLFYPRGINLLFGSELGARALAGPGELSVLATTALVTASPVDLPRRLLADAPVDSDERAGPVDRAAFSAAVDVEWRLFAEELAGHEHAPEQLDAVAPLRETLDACYAAGHAALAASGTLPSGFRHEVRALAGDLVRALDELDCPAAPTGPVSAEPAPEPAPKSEPGLEHAESEAEAELPGPPELTFQPDGIAGVADGYVMVEPASGWAPGGAESYLSPEGRLQLRHGLEARARFTLDLPGCRGWRCLSGGSRLDLIAAAVLEALHADAPDLADRIELGGRG